MKERFRKQKFLKNVGLQLNKNPRPDNQENDFTVSVELGVDICERFCFYYFDDNAQVICRSCYRSFKTWLDFRMHFNIPSCQISEINYKMNTYNDVYKKYKLRKAKTKKKINDQLSAAQLMDIEMLNIRKTRKRCYTNTRVVEINVLKSPSDSSACSSNSEKTTPIKTTKKEEVLDNRISGNESAEETKTIHPVHQNIPDSTKPDDIPNLPHDDRPPPPPPIVKTEWNADELSQASSDDQSSSSTHSHSTKYQYKENGSTKYQCACVICDERFSSKCLLTMHQVQHIKSDRSSYGVFMAALARSA